jgi:hypothetical protein
MHWTGAPYSATGAELSTTLVASIWRARGQAPYPLSDRCGSPAMARPTSRTRSDATFETRPASAEEIGREAFLLAARELCPAGA